MNNFGPTIRVARLRATLGPHWESPNNPKGVVARITDSLSPLADSQPWALRPNPFGIPEIQSPRIPGAVGVDSATTDGTAHPLPGYGLGRSGSSR